MKSFIFLLSLVTLFGGCECSEENIACPGFEGSEVERLLIQNGENGLSDAISLQLSSGGSYTKIVCTNALDQSNLTLGTTFIDDYALSYGPQQGSQILVDNVPLTEFSQAANSYVQLNTKSKKDAILSLFGALRQVSQKVHMETGTINSINLRLPLPFTVVGDSATTQNVENGVNLTWPIDPLGGSVYVIAYSYDGLTIESSESEQLTLPVYKIIKTPDDGNQFISNNVDLSEFPTGCNYIIQIVRLSHTLQSDTRDVNRKNLYLGIASSIKIMEKI